MEGVKMFNEKEKKMICDYCGAEKDGIMFFIGASKAAAWTMVEGTGKITCPACWERAMKDGENAIKKHIEEFNKKVNEYDNVMFLKVADQAKLIRSDLKKYFPDIKFKVHSKSYSGGASINISWTDGPSEEKINEIINQYEGGYFDGMTDYKGGYTKKNIKTGEKFHFHGDFIFYNVEYSEVFLLQALIEFQKTHSEIYDQIEIEKSDYGDYWNWNIPNYKSYETQQNTTVTFRRFLREFHNKNGIQPIMKFEKTFETIDKY
jgi:hypothetical protein